MFSFALLDEGSGKLHVVRDRAGVKPVYYVTHGGRFLLASEIKSLFGAINKNDWDIDSIALSQYLTYQTTLGERTLFSNVKQLLPGRILTLNIGNINQLTIDKFSSGNDTRLYFEFPLAERFGQTFGPVFSEIF